MEHVKITFANETVKRQWEAKPERETDLHRTQKTTVEGVKKAVPSVPVTGSESPCYMYSNPVERERMLIEQAMKQQQNATKKGIFSLFS